MHFLESGFCFQAKGVIFNAIYLLFNLYLESEAFFRRSSFIDIIDIHIHVLGHAIVGLFALVALNPQNHSIRDTIEMAKGQLKTFKIIATSHRSLFPF